MVPRGGKNEGGQKSYFETVLHSATLKDDPASKQIVNDPIHDQNDDPDLLDDYDPYEDVEFEINDEEETDESRLTDNKPNETAEAFKGLTEVLKEVIAKPEEKSKPVGKKRTPVKPVDMAELRKTFNEQLHETEDPFDLVTKTAKALVGGELAQQNALIQDLMRDRLKSNPENAYVLEHYAEEVEDTIASLSPEMQNDPRAYEWAISQIIPKHFIEIAKAVVKPEETEELDTQHKQTQTVRSVPRKTNMASSTSSSQQNQSRVPIKKMATSADVADALQKGMVLADYMEWKKRQKRNK